MQSLLLEVLLKHDETLPLNNSIVDLEEITGGSDLFCLTNTAACCKHRDTGSGPAGQWFFPNGTQIPNTAPGFSVDRGRGSIALTYTDSPDHHPPLGIYRCVINDSNDDTVTLFAGIYSIDTGK